MSEPESLMTAADNTPSASSSEAGAAGNPAPGEQQPAAAGNTPAPENQPETPGETEVEYAFKFEDGVEVDAPTLDELKALAKDLKLPLEQAQKIADLGAKQAQRWAEAQEKAIADVTAQWVEQVKADKEIGGDRFDANLATAKSALNQFGTPELTKLLNDSRLGNHPEVIRFFHKVGKALGDDTVVPGSRAAIGTTDPARRLYDNSNLK